MASKRVVFVDVDTQADFMLPGGRLYVPGAEKLIPNLERLMGFAREHRIPVISSTDAHTPDDPEFQQFPPHCVQGTEGQKKIPETILKNSMVLANQPYAVQAVQSHPQQWILEKPTLDMFTNPNAGKLVEELHADEYVAFGVATEYCVKIAVMGLLERGCKVALVTDAIEGIDRPNADAALREMEAAGARLVATTDVVGVA